MKKLKILYLVIFLIFALWTTSDGSSRTKFLSADITVPINVTWVDVTNFTSKQISIGNYQNASITFYVKGNNAACSKDVIFKFVTFDSLRNKWDTIEYISVSIPANGTTAVQRTVLVWPDVEKIKLLSVQNQETTATYTVDVNVSIFIK
jgi:hypothetical protein